MLLRFIFALLCLSAGTSLANADATQWVSDQLRISLRAGPGDEFEVLRILPTGTPLQTASERGDWVEVELADGSRGWVVSRYLEKERPAQLELPAVQDALERSQARLLQLEKELARARTELSELEALRVRARELEVAKIQLESTAGATMLTIGAGIALAGVLLGAFWPRRQGPRGISIPPRYFRS